MSSTASPATNWWMFHGDPAHTGYVGTGSNITSKNVASSLKVLHQLQLGGAVLSTPAIVDGFVYVGTANSHSAPGGNGGSLNKIDLVKGTIQTFTWPIAANERDSHSFTGMGCTPAVIDQKIYFSAFNGCVYCLDQATLKLLWVTNLRHADPAHNQPANNVLGMYTYPPVSGWSSPVVANGRVYVGVGEGENPFAFGFVYCLDGATGNVIWLYCTNQFFPGVDNKPNVVPAAIAVTPLPTGFTVSTTVPQVMGSSVWTGIAYDADLKRLYCSVGNPQPDGRLPTAGYSNGLLVLDSTDGHFIAFVQFPPDTSYRPSDVDVDVGGSATLYQVNGQKRVGIGCKNGGYLVLDPLSVPPMKILARRNLLPCMNNGDQIPTVDPHGIDDPAHINLPYTNAESNATDQENFYGTYSTAAVHPGLGRLFMGVGGNNYHNVAAGIDSATTPFMRVMDWQTLADAWPMDSNDPPRYSKAMPPMYTTAGESGLSVPAVVNDVVFMATSGVNLHAFSAVDGTWLWTDAMGQQTDSANGGYGYCLGPAISGNYVVAGALIRGIDGGVLKIYTLKS